MFKAILLANQLPNWFASCLRPGSNYLDMSR